MNVIRLVAIAAMTSSIWPCAAQKRPMSLDDIVLLREPLEPQLSPDGQWVTFVVKQARIPTNDYESSLQIVATAAATDPRVLRKASSFSNVRWSPASDALYYISDNGGPRQIKRLNPREAAVEDVVLRHNADITRFEISPDGQKIAFVSHELPTPSDRKNFESKGIVYDDTIHSAITLITDAW